MPADIKLDGELVIAEGTLKIDGTDLLLDSQERRVGNTSPTYRRALVHGFNDDLVINFNADYTGGVVLEGQVRLGGFRAPKPQGTADASPDGAVYERVDLEPGVAERLGDAVAGLKHPQGAQSQQVVRLPLDISTMFDEVEDPLNLIREIRRLRAAILSLNRRVEALEKTR